MSKLSPIVCYIIIVVVTSLVYYNSLSNGFVFDDDTIILSNPAIESTSNIPKFFTADEGFHKVIGRYYRPVVSSTYAIDYSIWKLDPYGYHLTNVIIHIICCVLLFKIFTVLFWRYKYRNLFSLFSALIFAVHPIHTEAVTWVSGRTDSLVTLFFFASFLCYLYFTREMRFDSRQNQLRTVKDKNYSYLAWSLFFYAAGLLTKEMIITMPVIILLYDFVYRKKPLSYFKENITAYIMFAVVTAAYLLLRYVLLKDVPERENYLYFIGKDAVVVVGTMLKTIPVYFRLLFAPFNLLYHYNGVIQDAKLIIDFPVLLSIAFIVLLLGLAYFFYKKDSIVSFCILFFFVSLLPVMNIIPTMSLMAERFLYLTSFSLVLLICHLSLLGSSKRDFSILTFGIVIIIALMSFLTYKRNFDWKDNNTLYLSAKDVEGSALLVNIANIKSNNKKYDDAIVLYKRAIEIRDNDVLAHHNLGLVYLIKGYLDSASYEISRGIHSDSLAPDGYFQMAHIYNLKNNKDSAIIMLEKLQRIAPDYKGTVKIIDQLKMESNVKSPGNLLADEKINTLQMQSYNLYNEKKYEEAIKTINELLKLSAADDKIQSGYLNNIAMCYAGLNKPDLEEKYFIEASKKDPENLNALNGLAAFYLRKNDKEKGRSYLLKILKVKPDNETARRKIDSLDSKK